VDNRLIWINIFLLFFIVLIPFSTTLSGDYDNVLEAVLLFHVNLLVASLLLSALAFYIRHNFNRLALDTGEEPVEKQVFGKNPPPRVYIIPSIILLAIAVSFFDTHASMLCYLLMPVILAIGVTSIEKRNTSLTAPIFPSLVRIYSGINNGDSTDLGEQVIPWRKMHWRYNTLPPPITARIPSKRLYSRLGPLRAMGPTCRLPPMH
jgi:hypothetical protein